MPRPATGLLNPNPIKTKLSDAQYAAWEALMASLGTDTAKALRAIALALIDHTPGSDRRRHAILVNAGLPTNPKGVDANHLRKMFEARK